MAHKLFPAKDITSITFVTLGLLAEGAREEGELRDELHELGWVRQGKLTVHSSIFRRMEEEGLVLAAAGKNLKMYQLTSAGYDLWSQYFDFCMSSIGRWTQLRQEKQLRDFVTLGALPPRATRRIMKQRAPTKQEQVKIMSASPPDFRTIYEFSIRTKARITDLLNARIENIDWDKNELMLEETSESGRLIEQRLVKLNDESRRVLKESVGDRVKGAIFLKLSGSEWRTEYLSTDFRRIRKQIGLGEDVMIAGRGGKVGIMAAMLDEDSSLESDVEDLDDDELAPSPEDEDEE